MGPPHGKRFTLLHAKPGLSTFADNPAGALEPLRLLFDKFMKELEGPLGKNIENKIPVKIFGTAGMRLLPSERCILFV